MDITKIEMILCALELGSFSRAAEIYSYTPSAMTHIADALEEEIGTSFIKRTHSGIEVSNEEIVKALQSICDIKNELCGKATQKKTLTIGTYSSVSKNLLPNIVKRFCDEHPDVHINIRVVNTLNDLTNCGADIIIGDKIPSGDYIYTEIMQDSFVAVFPKSKTQYTEFKTDEYYNETFILSSDIKTRKTVSKELFDDVIVIDSHDDSPIIQMVKAEIGISVLPMLSVMDSDGVRLLPISPPVSRTLWLFYKKSHKSKPLILEFIKCLNK